MKTENPTIVRTYHMVMCEEEVAHGALEHEFDGIEYESFKDAEAAVEKALNSPRIYNAWIESTAVDSEGNLWDADYWVEVDEDV